MTLMGHVGKAQDDLSKTMGAASSRIHLTVLHSAWTDVGNVGIHRFYHHPQQKRRASRCAVNDSPWIFLPPHQRLNPLISPESLLVHNNPLTGSFLCFPSGAGWTALTQLETIDIISNFSDHFGSIHEFGFISSPINCVVCQGKFQSEVICVLHRVKIW